MRVGPSRRQSQTSWRQEDESIIQNLLCHLYTQNISCLVVSQLTSYSSPSRCHSPGGRTCWAVWRPPPPPGSGPTGRPPASGSRLLRDPLPPVTRGTRKKGAVLSEVFTSRIKPASHRAAEGQCVPGRPPPTCRWLGTCWRQLSGPEPRWSDARPRRTRTRPQTPTGNIYMLHININEHTYVECMDPSEPHLGQEQVGLAQQVRVMFGHHANHIIEHAVLLVHGDGEVRLIHCGKQPVCTHTDTQTHTHTHTHKISDVPPHNGKYWKRILWELKV